MKNFILILLLTIVKLIILCGIYTASAVYTYNLTIPIAIIVLLLYIIIQLKYSNKLCKKLKLKKNTYILLNTIIWLTYAIIINSLFFKTKLIDMLPNANGSEFLDDLIYILIPILLLGYAIISSITIHVYDIFKKNKP